MSPSRLLGGLLRAGDRAAGDRVRRALERCHGDVRAAAADLGVGETTLHGWIRTIPALADAARQGRSAVGARQRAAAAARRLARSGIA